MKITIIGAGYVGLVTGACLADNGNEVWCVDKNENKIKRLLAGEIPIYEPGLEPLVRSGRQGNRLHFTTNLKEGLEKADLCFLAVDTPPAEDGAPNLTNVFAVAKSLGEVLEPLTQVVTKSTVPVGTTLKVKEIVKAGLQKRGLSAENFFVASNPEFLKEGTSVQDFCYPDRVVIGVEKEEQAAKLVKLYEPFMRKQNCILVMDIASAELAKYAANAMLANRISFMNELSRISEKMGANIDKIRESIGWDPRIGNQFLYSGLGYGGSCLPKDVQALSKLSAHNGCQTPLLQAIDQTNRQQKENFWNRIAGYYYTSGGLQNKTIAVWGLSFKPKTDDIREAPSLFLIEKLLSVGAKVRVFDPVAMENVRSLFSEQIEYAPGDYQCLEGADGLIIVTEWNEFRSPNFDRMKKYLKRPAIFDGRNLYSPQQMREMGFDYFSIGR